MAIDSTRVKANASPDRVDREEALRAERARMRQKRRRSAGSWTLTPDGA